MPAFSCNPGIYVVMYRLRRACILKVGKLGTFSFPAGFYFYCGSAKGGGGLDARLQRHLNSQREKHWHIDYLKPFAEPVNIWAIDSHESTECELVRLIEAVDGVQYPVCQFGASDCREKCISHLLHGDERINPDHLDEQLKVAFPSCTKMKVNLS